MNDIDLYWAYLEGLLLHYQTILHIRPFSFKNQLSSLSVITWQFSLLGQGIDFPQGTVVISTPPGTVLLSMRVKLV